MELGVSKDGRGEKELFELAESLNRGAILCQLRDEVVLFFLSVLNQGGRDSGIVRDELAVVPTLSEEGPKSLQGGG